MQARRRPRRLWMAAAGCVAALAPMVAGVDALGAVVGLAVRNQSTNTTFTTSTKHVTTTNRADLEDAPAPECEFPGSPSTLVDETSTDLEPVVSLSTAIGPADIMVGEDQTVPFHVDAGTTNFDALTTYEQVVTQYFQATAAGEACEVVAAARFTG